jgi:hypothetical protein
MGGHQNNIRKYSNWLSIILFIDVGGGNRAHDGYSSDLKLVFFFFYSTHLSKFDIKFLNSKTIFSFFFDIQMAGSAWLDS